MNVVSALRADALLCDLPVASAKIVSMVWERLCFSSLAGLLIVSASWCHALPQHPPAAAGFVFAGMAVVSFLVILPASRVSDRLGRKWTIVPSAVAMATALLLMAAGGTV
jgi:MFS family permease